MQNVTATGTSGTADFYAQGLATFNGIVSAPSISVESSDIDIVSGASLGVLNVTNSVALASLNNGPMYIGSGLTSPAGSYTLDEQGDIRAHSVSVLALGSSDGPTPDIIIGNVKIEGSLNTSTSGGAISNIIVESAKSPYRFAS